MSEPMITFWQVVPVPGGRLPSRASRFAGGTAPVSSTPCGPFNRANIYGWHLYPPRSFALAFDGASVWWAIAPDEDTHALSEWEERSINDLEMEPLMPDVINRGFFEHWQEYAPPEVKENAPPFLSMSVHDPSTVQIWTGAFCRTRQGVWIKVRGPVNDTRRPMGCEALEGIVKSDTYGGFLFGNLKFIRTDTPVYFRHDVPIFHIEPMLSWSENDLTMEVHNGIESMTDERWASYYGVVKRVAKKP